MKYHFYIQDPTSPTPHYLIEAIIEQLFRVLPNSSERAYLFEKVSPTQIGPEEIRPCVFGSKNRNIRIEFAGKRDKAYPENGRPILVVREVGTRIFHYILLSRRILAMKK